MRRTTEDWVIILLILSIIGLVIFIVYDRCTGYSKQIMADITDKWHEHQSHTETKTDSKGRHTTSTHSHDWYWVAYHREDGVNDRHDVGWWYFDDYHVGRKIVVYNTIGGVSGIEYRCGISVFNGLEGECSPH